MGKVVKKVLKIATLAAVTIFAPPLAGAALGSIGLGGVMASTLGTIAASGLMGAAVGAIMPGMSVKSGLLAGALGGSGLFGKPATTFREGLGTLGIKSGTSAGTVTTDAAAAGAGGAQGAAGGVTQAAGAAQQGAAQQIGAKLGGSAVGGNVLSRGLQAVAPQLLASGLAGTPGAGLMRAQQAELERAQQVNEALTEQRMAEARKLIDEAAYFDPEYMGRQAAEAAMIRGGIQETEGTRGLTGERLAAEQRRYRLGTARTAGSAYQQGYGTGVGSRTNVRTAGIAAMPSAYPMTTGDSAMGLNMRLAGMEARRAEEQGLAALFGQVLGRPATA